MRINRSIPILATCLLWAALALSPTQASAQDIDLTREQQIIAVASIGVLSVSTTTIATVQMSTVESQEEDYEQKIKDMKKFVRIQRYLNDGQHELELALALGAGDALKDFAALMCVPSEDFAAWSKSMRTRRESITQVLRTASTLARAKKLYGLALTPQLASSLTLTTGRLAQ